MVTCTTFAPSLFSYRVRGMAHLEPVIDRIMAFKGVHILTPIPVNILSYMAERIFSDVIKLMIFDGKLVVDCVDRHRLYIRRQDNQNQRRGCDDGSRGQSGVMKGPELED